MKFKLFTTIALFFVCTASSFSQNSGLILGVSGGASLNKISFTGDYTELYVSGSDQLPYLMPAESSKFAPRFNGGVDVGFRYGSFSILSGVHYVQHGGIGKVERSDPNDPFVLGNNSYGVGYYEGNFHFNTLSFPILLRYEKMMDAIGFSISLGPVINRLNGKANFVRTGKINSQNVPSKDLALKIGSDPTDILSGGFTSFMIQPAVHFNVGESGKLNIGLVYQSSGNFGNDKAVLTYVNGSVGNIQGTMKSSSIGLNVGYEYRMDFTLGAKY